MLGAFLLCGDEALEPLLIEFGPEGRVPCVGANGLTPVNIAALGELLGVASYEEVLGQCGNEHRESGSGESGVWSIPDAVVQGLNTSDELERVAERWVATAELHRDRWQKSDGLRVLRQLSELVTHQEPGQALWYWWSL